MQAQERIISRAERFLGHTSIADHFEPA